MSKKFSAPQQEGPPMPNLGELLAGIKQHVPFSAGPAKMLILTVVALLFLALMFASAFLDYVKPYEFGIKQVNIGIKRGVLEKVYTPGYWFVKPFGMEKMHHFPRHLQVLDLTLTEKEPTKSPAHAYERAAKIQTSDGFFVDVDATILYRIVDPYKLMTTLGPEKMYLVNGILPKAEPILKQALGELNIEDFYNSPLRTEKAEMARKKLDDELAPKGMKVEQVLIRYFKYSDEIQKSIEAKKLQDQLVFKNQAEAKAFTEEAITKKVEQEGEMKVKVILQEGEAYKTEKKADQDLYTRQRAAEADLLVKTAEAEATQLKNSAMQTPGQDRKIALEMAKTLEGLDTILLPAGGANGVNPLDLEGILTLFDVQSNGRETASPVPMPAPPVASSETSAPVPAATSEGAVQ